MLGETHAPPVVNWLLLGTSVLSLAILLYRGTKLERLAGIAVLLCVVQVLALSGGFQGSTMMHDASSLAGGLSSTTWGIPLRALYAAWSVLALAWLGQRAIVHALSQSKEVASGVGTGLSVLLAAFGLRAVIGYASGSTSLFVS